MSYAFTPADAERLMETYIKEESLRTHCRIVSGVMGVFAEEAEPDQADRWRTVGMLHDIDFEQYPDEHCQKCVDILRANGLDDALIHSVTTHGYGFIPTCQKPQTGMERTLYAVDELTGLITACAMVRPSKSVMDMEVSSVKKKFKQPSFAAGVDRDAVRAGAEMLGLDVDTLMQKTLDAMKRFPHPFRN